MSSVPGPSDDLSTFFDVSLDMLCIRDMAGRFVRVSPSWTTVLGWTAEELVGQPLLPLIHPDDVPATADLMQAIQSDGEIVGFVNRYRHRDGRYRQLEWRARLSGDQVFAVARDVTDRVAAEAEMKAAHAAAQAANQAKTDFLANMSHEIRTPLNGVIGVVAALAQTELSPAQREMVGLIETSGLTLERLVSDILDLSKIEAGRLEIETAPFDLAEALEGVLHINRLKADEKGLAFAADFDEDARGAFLGDATRLKQVVGNLLSNAVKFTEQGGVRLRLSLTEAGDGPALLTVEVRDTGVGFDAQAAANLFQRFSQADTTITRRFGGTGLGLSICKAIVEMMGGEISASSEPGRGSRFRATFPLPRVLDLAAYDARSTSDAAETPLVRVDALRVLLAEDHPINQKVVQLILAPLGAEITVTEDGAQALAAFQTSLFDLVLMDMQMPVMDGLTATMALRDEERRRGGPRTPIIMLSANAMIQHRRDAMAAGADHHIAKPITAHLLMDGIETVLERVGVAAEAEAEG
ncbi:MAG: ATP-binding protein [Phenylobacterium sp.]|uniref:ATP-binding protein n=1 Tax=Phenylobacterium sp. TaxID=1871053 RepID=UPI002727B444|nr:ATP-binding protein [Phenylobacterium sp.]MDO8910834.1 ATP-binding protein [Phenylobacterium sp.]MDP3102488.1 ATP-binding protein [Phenylobacterium sp.]